jgi:hypothetical protein
MPVLSAVLQIVRSTKCLPNVPLLATAFPKSFVRFGVGNPHFRHVRRIYCVRMEVIFVSWGRSLKNINIVLMKKLTAD